MKKYLVAAVILGSALMLFSVVNKSNPRKQYISDIKAELLCIKTSPDVRLCPNTHQPIKRELAAKYPDAPYELLREVQNTDYVRRKATGQLTVEELAEQAELKTYSDCLDRGDLSACH
jgi:hypothetical protein